MEAVQVYGSGDVGTTELMAAMRRKRVPYQFFDIRKREFVDGGMARVNLTFLLQRGMTTVPQVFGHSGRHIGGSAEAAAWLKTIKPAKAELLTA